MHDYIAGNLQFIPEFYKLQPIFDFSPESKSSMRKFTTVLFSLSFLYMLLFTACSDATKTSSGENGYAAMDSTERAEFSANLQNKISNNRFEVENGKYFKKLGEIAQASDDYKNTAMYYMFALQADPQIEGKKVMIHTLIQIAKEQMKNKTIADMFKLAFAEAYPQSAQAPKYSKTMAGVDSLEELLGILKSNMARSERGAQDPVSKKVIDGSEIYATILPDADNAPIVIQEAAMLLQTKGAMNKALSFYDWLITKYPDTKYGKDALFMKGFIFDTSIRDTARAHKYYAEFIEKYPDNELADDAQILIDKLGEKFTPPPAQ